MSHGSKAVIAACLANAGIAVAKLIGFAFTGAASMLAESVHSFADTGNQVLLLLGEKRGRKAPDEKHAFGYGRERYFWSFVVAMVIFALGAVYAMYEGIHRLIHPEPIESPLVAVGILAIAAALEGWSFRTAMREANLMRGELSWFQFIRRTKAAELPVVLLEDTGALLGLIFALVGVGIATLTGDARYDAMGSIAIGALLGFIAVLLSFEMQSLLIGESADPLVEEQIRAAMRSGPAVRKVIHLRTVHLGPDDLLVAAKLEFDAALSMHELCERIDEVEVLVRKVVPDARLLFIEPDVYRDPNITLPGR